MEIVYKNINELKPYEKNPRRNDAAVKYVMESIKQFGFKVPIVIDNEGVVVCGHTRLKASKKLKLKEVPCIIADDLSEEQIKAFRLADNKVSEFAEWDFDILSDELFDIDFDMELFGFEKPEEPQDSEIKQNERVRTDNAYNLDIIDHDKVDGFYQMPIIECDNYIPERILPFNYALSSNEHNYGIHFYIDDYQFERVWNNPNQYVDALYKYDCIFSPDFSLYVDMPMAMKIWNVYRSRLIGQFYQSCGIKVIPTLSWCEKETFEFCFDGVEKGSIVSVSTIGVKRDHEALQIWKDGVNAMIEHIKPSLILVYGGKIDFDYGDVPIKYYENKVTTRMNNSKDVT